MEKLKLKLLNILFFAILQKCSYLIMSEQEFFFICFFSSNQGHIDVSTYS